MATPTHWLMLLIVLALSGPISADELSGSAPAGARLTLDRLYSLPHLIGTAPGGFSWSTDGRYLAFLWNDEGFNFRDVWMVDVENPDSEPIRLTAMTQIERPDPESFENPLAFAEAEETWERDAGVTVIAWHPDSSHLVITFHGDLWKIALGAEPERLTDTTSPERQAGYSPDGSLLTYLRDGEVWLRTSSQDETQKTHLGEPGLEIVDFEWAPDGSSLAILQRDERGVAIRGIPDYLTGETTLREVRRAFPGEAPVMHRFGLIDSDGVRWLDWRTPEPGMLLGHRWSPDGSKIAVDTSDLYAKDRQIFIVDVEAGRDLTPRRIARDLDPNNETFYYWRIEWSTDSSLLYFLSDRDEDYHVYAVAASGEGQPKRLTQGEWAIAEIFPVDGGLIAVGNRGQAEERHLFRVDDAGGEPERISQRPGTHAPTISPDGSWAAVHFSSQSMPGELLLTSLATAGTETGRFNKPEAGTERRVTYSPLPEFEEYEWVEAEFVTFPSHVDGSTLHGRIALPPDFDPTRTYPAIVGSVYTDSVRNQWGWRTAHPTWGLDQFLLQEGFVVFNVDMRGSWGRGRDHRRGIRLDYGGMDIEDLDSGVRYLSTLGTIDMDRIGIWGSSYGGLMTAMSLFRKPGLYAAGIAGAPATNVWHALTGQMAVMMQPQDQPEEYADSSPFVHAAGLEDPLMIVHGMRDWVVLFKDSVVLTQRLILLGKNVELVALPNAGHGWDAEGLAQTRFAFHKMVEFFDRYLKDASPGSEEPSHGTD